MRIYNNGIPHTRGIQHIATGLKFLLGMNMLWYANAVWDISLVVTQHASGALGGEAFSIQPNISVFDLKGVTKHTNLIGRIVATLEYSRTTVPAAIMKNHIPDNELLGIESSPSNNNGGGCTVNEDEEISFPVVDGDVTFVGLCVNTAFDKYFIKYTLKDEFNITLGFVTGPQLVVEVGNPYQIGVIQCPRVVFGGSRWDLKPVVAIQDRGRNTVETVNEGNVTVSLASNSHSEEIMWEEDASLMSIQRWREGIASFRGIMINKAGMYQLNFTTDLVLTGDQQCHSTNVSVNIGPPHALVIVEEPSENRIYGGEAFKTQPKLHIIDRGDNVLRYDDSSIVFVSIYSNPSNASLAPIGSRIANSSMGVVQFEHLKMDKNGTGFWFRYELYTFNNDTNDYLDTNITKFGSMFNVEVAPPDHIEFLQLPSSEMWAGNQPFLEQPILALKDAGGNIVEYENCGTLNAIMTPSLSQTSHIVVDTTNDDIPFIESLHFLPDDNQDGDNLFSVGHNISIIATFSQEVEVVLNDNTTYENAIVPTLELNVVEQDGTHSKAHYVKNNIPSRHLEFQYTVSPSSQQNEVNIDSRSSLNTNDYAIVDAFQRNVQIILPSAESVNNLLLAQNKSVHSDPATIVNITTNVMSGEYAAGHLINFVVEFNHEVSVQNVPEIPINVNSSIVIIDIAELGTSYSKSYFYVWYKGQRSKSIPWNASSEFVKKAFEQIGTMLGSVCVSKTSSIVNPGGFRWAVRLQNNLDDFSSGLLIQTADVRLDHEASNISIAFLTTNEAINDWILIDGEDSMCTHRSATYLNGSGTKILVFQYEVLPGDRVSELEFSTSNPVVNVRESSGISNAVNKGSFSNIDAELSWSGTYVGKNISIDASRPFVERVEFKGIVSQVDKYHVGDELYFSVKFNKKVAVEGNAYFTLDVSRFDNKAFYFSGSGTNEIMFKYTVLPNHWTSALKYDLQNQIQISSGYIRHLSDNPSLDVKLSLPPTDSPFQLGGSVLKIDGRTPLIISIFINDDQVNNFKENDGILISVEFSSEVTILNGKPALAIAIGDTFREAPYIRGNASTTLEFQYEVKLGDMSPPNDISCRMLCVSSGCLDGVSTEGYIKQYSLHPSLDANLKLPYPSYEWKVLNQMPIYSRSGIVTVNTSNAPLTKIENITLLHQSQIVSIGEVLRIQVTFSDEVSFRGDPPELKLNTDSNAIYEYGSGTTIFTFVLIPTIDDVIQSLNWKILDEIESPILCQKNASRSCSLMNKNNQYVDLQVKTGVGYNIKEMTPTIKIDSSTPSIQYIQVVPTEQPQCQNRCNYTAGDTIKFIVKYDLPVSVMDSRIKVKLNVKDVSSKDPIFAHYNETQSNNTDLVFLYFVQEGHSTFGEVLLLSCEDVNNCNIIGPEHSIRRLATYPTLSAEIKLPVENVKALNKELLIDGTNIPRVVFVESRNGTGVYSPGDTILIDVSFTEFVHVVGVPTLLLNVGRNQTEAATYIYGSKTKLITFKYNVKANHCVHHLDYVDIYSLEASSTNSVIKRLSTNPTMIVDLRLPLPGSEDSLGGHSLMKIDCRPPYIVKIWSTNEKGRYSTGANLTILVKFSREVVVNGIPIILLETGKRDRYAVFVSQIDMFTLNFKYQIELGDQSNDLDYWTDESLNRISGRIMKNGGSIMLPATLATVHADLNLNPSFGFLDGLKNIPLENGVARFDGLKIGKRGSKYKIRFEYHSCTNNFTYEVSTFVSIHESAEYHLFGNDFDREAGDLLGTSVALDGQFLAVGAPNKRNAFSEVQVLTVKSDTNVLQNEIQLINTKVDKAEAIKQIQTITTSAMKNETISGYFSITYIDDEKYLYAAPLDVPADISAGQLEVLMRNHFPNLGPIQVTRTENNVCVCYNAWTWRLTFMDASNDIRPLIVNGDGLIGANKTINTDIVKNTTMIDGFFTLRNPTNFNETRSIAINASAIDMKIALEQDLGLFVKNVMVADLDERKIPQLGRRWTLLFFHHIGPNGLDIDVPNLEVAKSMLSGTNAYVWTHVGFEGRGKVNGSFALSFRRSDFTALIPFNASSLQIETALESLDSINDVSVSGRKDISQYSSHSGHTWTITFNSVKVRKGNVWIDDFAGQSVGGNMPPLDVKSALTGWNAKIIVEHEFGSGKEDTQAQWMAKTMGKDGLRSGHVIILRGNSRQWFIESFLLPSDGDSNDNFGQSVSLSEPYVVVGAPNKEVYGVFEQQTLVCDSKAINGTFSIQFRGHHSDPIPFDATAQEMKKAILGVYRNTSKIHSLPEISLEGSEQWDNPQSGFCTSSGNNVTITLMTPDGVGLSTMKSSHADIESLLVDNSELVSGQVTVIESRQGTRILSGETRKKDSITTLGIQSGSVYLFKRYKDCEFCSYYWKENKKLTSLDGFDHPHYSAKFGWSTVMTSDSQSNDMILAVGSPGFNNASGKVYTFRGQNSDWRYENSLSSSLWNDVSPDADFGHSIAMENNTILVGSPGFAGRKGAVYVFLRHIDRMGFLSSQKISGPSELEEGDEFGHTVSLSGHRAVICAPNHNDTVQSGIFNNNELNEGQVGSCYVYERKDTYKPFELMQKLSPSNVRARNRFGYSSDIHDDKIVIGQLEGFIEHNFFKNNSLDIRGRAHIFTYNSSSWNEVSYLFPFNPQSDDLFGSAVAIDGNTAVVGAPNRILLDVNSGCASVYHLSFLNFYFPISSYTVQEGKTLSMRLERRNNTEDEIVGVKSIDRNTDSQTQRYLETLFDFDTMDGLGPTKTAVDLLCGSEAFGRDFIAEGVNTGNLWVEGTFDYKGRSDYAQIDSFFLYQSRSSNTTINLHTTNDQVYESTDERLCVQIFLPGIFVSSLGDKQLEVNIKDDDDGFHDPLLYTKKILSSREGNEHQFGAAIDFAEDGEMLVISGQIHPRIEETISNTGGIFVLNKITSKHWNEQILIPKLPMDTGSSSNFGQSVSISTFHSSGDILLLVGAPGHSCAYVFFFDRSKNEWKEEAVLQPFDETYIHAKHNFATKKSTVISDNIAFIGASGLETVFVYRRFIGHNNTVSWRPWTKLRSSDYDFDLYDNGNTIPHMHYQKFGTSISYKDRLLLVGAPYADYGNQGNKTEREYFNTNGVHNKGLGRGKVYVFHSSPMIVKVMISSNSTLRSGNLRLCFNTSGENLITAMIPIDATEAAIESYIEATKVEQVNVQVIQHSQLKTIKWSIAFMKSFSEIDITAVWKNHGCDQCEQILDSTKSNATITIETVSKSGDFNEEWILQGDDVTSGDYFGSAVAMGKNEAIIGAMFSSAKTRTTWDFETGTLIGWVANGNAFDYQPVFGDNSKRRTVYEGFGKPDSRTSGLPQSANMQGRYYIGTFEKRPGNKSDYLNFDDRYTEGTIQGDSPTGTLTSDPFMILGDEISFLIGGGCDHLTEYIELLIDGFVTMRTTGECHEGMERMKWKVGEFIHRAARIRIVDKSEDLWGHINIDDITFNWKSNGINSGGCSNSGGELPRNTERSKQHYSGQEESPLSGAAYVFVRNCTLNDWVLAQQGEHCEWKQNQRMTPSDKRSQSLFGSSVSIDSAQGLAIVGSHYAPLFGMYKETPSAYPHNDPWIRFPLKQKLEYLMKTGVTLSPTAGNLRVINSILNDHAKESFFLAEKFSEQAGAIYIFRRTDAVKNKLDGTMLRAPFWQNFEHAKVVPSDLSGNDWFGNDVKIVGDKVVAAAMWNKHCCNNTRSSGAVYLFNTLFHSLKFSLIEYEAIEGIDEKVSVTILRDESTSNTTLTVGFSTSDLSADGIDYEKFQNCLNTPIEERSDCGDYQQTSGYITFQPGELSRSFDVKVIDDYCWERHLEYVQLNMHIPGGTLIQGERYRAQLKIDDDDWLSKNTTQLCS